MEKMCYITDMGKHRARRLPSELSEDSPSGQMRKEGEYMNIAYGDLFQFCLFIVALVGLCYTIFKDKK